MLCQSLGSLVYKKTWTYWIESSAGPQGGWGLEHLKWWNLHPQRCSKYDWMRSWQHALLDLLWQEVGPLGLQRVFPAYMLLWFRYISYVSNLLFSVIFSLLNYLLNLTSYGKIKFGTNFIITSCCSWRMVYLHILTSCACSFKSRKPLRDLKCRTIKVMLIFA